MKKVRLLALLLIAVTLFSFTSCDNTTPAERFAQMKEAIPYVNLLNSLNEGDCSKFAEDSSLETSLKRTVLKYLELSKANETSTTEITIVSASGTVEAIGKEPDSTSGEDGLKANNVKISYKLAGSEETQSLSLSGTISEGYTNSETSYTGFISSSNVIVNGIKYGDIYITYTIEGTESDPVFSGTYDGKEVDSNLLKKEFYPSL